jgi:hypothetical protein
MAQPSSLLARLRALARANDAPADLTPVRPPPRALPSWSWGPSFRGGEGSTEQPSLQDASVHMVFASADVQLLRSGGVAPGAAALESLHGSGGRAADVRSNASAGGRSSRRGDLTRAQATQHVQSAIAVRLRAPLPCTRDALGPRCVAGAVQLTNSSRADALRSATARSRPSFTRRMAPSARCRSRRGGRGLQRRRLLRRVSLAAALMLRACSALGRPTRAACAPGARCWSRWRCGVSPRRRSAWRLAAPMALRRRSAAWRPPRSRWTCSSAPTSVRRQAALRALLTR